MHSVRVGTNSIKLLNIFHVAAASIRNVKCVIVVCVRDTLRTATL